ncbi:urea hydro-lyase/cyanamide hydratase [Penicillium canariense]|uniref:cyanamide hydratase n=1 Tax=Penicillium canariense TaxID=189055 RepID=A0A9W9LUK4_9EURO|nr:urea hydro-lyase/cyanamide hydratase [Penicillium canariense]KAJ5175967.1 urea hydro-lyase/cyanamide hydratase [Penicillium canariense]
MSSSAGISVYGFTPVLSSASTLLETDPPSAAPVVFPVAQTPIPSTPLAQRIDAYAKAHLPTPTYNHSLRVYHYGIAIKRYRFPTWAFSDETYFLACLLHDIGTTEENLNATKMSFEFYGGFLALDVLQHQGDSKNATAPKDQAESVAEAIIRHQDLCQKGKITAVGQLLQLATIFDNAGLYSDIVHPSTIEDVTKHFPRLQWSNCFARTIEKENKLKPWSHTSTLGEKDFSLMVLGNTLMAPYE